MRCWTLPVLVLWTATAHAAVMHVPIKSGLALKPGESYTITIDATEPTEIGWQAVQAKRCTTNCVQATDLTGGIRNMIATALGASVKYTPASRKISVEYKNMSSDPVTIDVYRVSRSVRPGCRC